MTTLPQDAAEPAKVRRISPSQLDLWHRCPRRWAFVHKAKRREPFTGAAQAGTETHKILEDQGPWDKEWTAPDTGKLYPVGQMAALLQSQTPPNVVARERRWEVDIEGLPFVGVTDFYSEEIVGDYKTTSSKRNAKLAGAKDPSKDLLTDPQRLFYTALVPSAKRTLWLYGTWDTMSVTPREVEIDREADKKRLHLRVLQPADTMLNTPDDVDPLSMKPNVNECSKFPPHGCPFKSECFPPGKRMPVVTNSKESDRAMESLVERLRAKASGTVPVVAAQQPSEEDVAIATAALATEKAAEQAAAEQAATDAEKPKRTRVKKPAPAEVPSADAVIESSKVFDTRNQSFETQARADAESFIIETLFLDCIPLTSPFENAFSYIGPAAAEVCADMHVPHFGLVDFSRGGPALAAQLRANLSGKRIKSLYAETKSQEGKAVMNVLISVSKNVIRGVF